ncbi:zinc finger CCHC domain-containing protein 8 homolog [Neocloeon triangulifer]|uniref:zinc finger CCHC domain-containing protein 8 homolog n=1 Tax=Neocloeon triangulifer TaxID=2078957 RepID=UPI00286F4568|nr:zinc finger CCHC domain-containing protein 8 homolog [Neocloeon triangulifer]
MEDAVQTNKSSLAEATRQEKQKDIESARSKINEMRNKYDLMRKRKLDDDVQIIGDDKAEVSIDGEQATKDEEDASPTKKAKSDEVSASVTSKLPSFSSLVETPLYQPVVQPEVLEMHNEKRSREIEIVDLDDEKSTPPRNNREKDKKQLDSLAGLSQITEHKKGDLGKSLVKITFSDQTVADSFSKAIKEALIQILSAPSATECSNSRGSEKLEIIIRESDLNEEVTRLEGQIFTLDTEPITAALRWQVPSYQQSFKTIDGQIGEQEEEEKKSGGSCFNCDGKHLISECPKPIDEKVVSERRAKFMSERRSNQTMRTSRYHIDEEQKFCDHRPGHLSEELRMALGLRPNQLPIHIYRMRVFGYPPGWLEEAKVSHSGISLIEDSASQSNEAEETQGDAYDVSKIVDYPGFNTHCPRGTFDESRMLGMPPMDWNFSKDAMVQMIGGNQSKPYVTKKLENRKSNSGSEVKNDDMDIERLDDEVVILDSVGASNSDESPESPVEIPQTAVEQKPDSPDLEILEANKLMILDELNVGVVKDQSPPKSPEPNIDNSVVSVCATPEPSIGRSMSTALGTPVVESWTPFEKLPTAEKFSQGVSEHLNFENLPGATGKYEKMKGIINKVRKTMNCLNNEAHFA